jgi:hypothetical protein
MAKWRNGERAKRRNGERAKGRPNATKWPNRIAKGFLAPRLVGRGSRKTEED